MATWEAVSTEGFYQRHCRPFPLEKAFKQVQHGGAAERNCHDVDR